MNIIKSFSSLLIIWIVVVSCQQEGGLDCDRNYSAQMKGVFTHFKDDPLKLKAAEFLISNMEYHSFPSSTELNEYYLEQDSITEHSTLDSLAKFLPAILEKADWVTDSQLLDSTFLIRHIEQSFEMWKSPWSKELSFEDFCEHLLPYRIGCEKPSNWLPRYSDSAYAIVGQILDTCRYTRDDLQNILIQFSEEFPISILYSSSFPGGYNAEILLNMKRGSCKEYSLLGMHLLRSLGIPVAMDKTPQWANRSMGHDWNVFLTEKDSLLDFSISSSDSIGTHIKKRPEKFAKVFRSTYSVNKSLLEMRGKMKNVPRTFASPFLKDVTNLYLKDCQNITLNLTGSIFSRPEYAFLCTFNNSEWFPVHWAKTGWFNTTFTDMGRGIAYLPAYYVKGELIPAGNPFILTHEGSMKELEIDTTRKSNMKLLRKYARFPRMDELAAPMVGSIVEGSNRADFKDAVPLMTVREIPGDVNDSIIHVQRKFRYIRWKMPLNNVGDLQKVVFYGKLTQDGTEKELIGDTIGFPKPQPGDMYPYWNAMDSMFWTHFSKPEKGLGYVGLDLGKGNEVYLTRVHFHPCSDANYIFPGDEYELCYWDEGKWNSMGRQIATSHELIYHDVPQGGLYLLHNHTIGKEERIFTYENGIQVWW